MNASAQPDPTAGPAPARRALSPETVGLAALFLFALGLRLAGAGWGLPQVYEEATPMRVAWSMWAWDGPHGFDGNPHTFGYPSLVFYLDFIGQALLYAWLKLTGAVHSATDFRVLYALDKTSFMLIGRAISALFGAGLVPASYGLARRLAGAPAGWAAAVLVALAPALVLRATEVEVDLPLAFFVTLGCVQALRLLERPTLRNGVWAGVLAGLAASSKYPGMIVLVPCALALALAPREESIVRAAAAPVPTDARNTRGRRARGAVAPRAAAAGPAAGRLRVLVVLLATTALVFFVTSPYVLLDRAEFLRDWANQREHMAQGHFGVEGGPAFLYNASALAARLLGWPLALLALAGIVILAGWERRPRALLAASLPVVYLAIVGTWTMKADRYLLLMVPVGFAFASATVAWALERTGRVRAGGSAAAAWTLIVAACASPLAFQYVRGDLLERFRPDTRTEALHWVQQNVPEGALIVTEQYAPDLANFTSPELMAEVAPRLAEISHRPPFYAVQFVPMFQVDAERSAAFYDLALYGAADLFVVTSSVRSRYVADPTRYARQCAFYELLERRWPRAAHFTSVGHAGPEISIFRNPDHVGWFPSRRDVPEPVPAGDSRSGMENFFYWNLGVNYETAGHFGLAINAYRIALHYAPRSTDVELYGSIAQRLAYSLLQTRSPDATLAYLHSAEAQAALTVEGQVLHWVASQVESDATQFAKLGIPRLRS
jgi:dolichyl-phosphate-mannose-protein mannosyltransferase